MHRSVRLPLALLLILSAALIALAALAGSGRAAAAGPGELSPTGDSYISRNNPDANLNGNTLLLGYDNFGIFNPSDFTYLKFDLTGQDMPITNALLVLTAVSNSSNAAEVVLGLYTVPDDSWDADTLTYNNAPAPDQLIQTLTIPGDHTGAIVFDGGAPEAHLLIDYLEAQRTGDRVASLRIQIESVTSPTFIQGTLSMEDAEGSFDGQSGNEPLLTLSSTPTAVQLTSVGVQVGPVESDVPGFALVLLAALTALVIVRRHRAPALARSR